MPLKELMPYVLIIASTIFSYATNAARLDSLERTVAAQSSKYEKEVVPRAEHIEMNRRLEERLAHIENSLTDLTRYQDRKH